MNWYSRYTIYVSTKQLDEFFDGLNCFDDNLTNFLTSLRVLNNYFTYNIT